MKLIYIIFSLTAVMCTTESASAQGIAVNTSGAKADSSAMLDVKSTTQGLLLPRMTLAQKNAIVAPADGLLVFQTDGTRGLYYYDAVAVAWVAVTTPAAVIPFITAPTPAGSTSPTH